MSLRERIRAFLHPDALPDRLATVILARVVKLEDDATRHELVLRESADQIARHLKRVAAIEQRSEAREEGGSGARHDLTRRLLDIKLGKGGS